MAEAEVSAFLTHLAREGTSPHCLPRSERQIRLEQFKKLCAR
jgi:hypothetical protein